MDEIPESVMKSARDHLRQCGGMTAEETVARAVLAEREACAAVADLWEAKGDEKFSGCIADHDKGQKNIELAAAASAGMSHQARYIAAAIRAR